MAPTIRAVLFDIGGVIADSPIMAIRRYCTSIDIPDINRECSVLSQARRPPSRNFKLRTAAV